MNAIIAYIITFLLLFTSLSLENTRARAETQPPLSERIHPGSSLFISSGHLSSWTSNSGLFSFGFYRAMDFSLEFDW
ncbi:unnamed protein product [Lathyrus oleraceus]